MIDGSRARRLAREIYNPDNGEAPPPWLRGFETVVIELPEGVEAEDALVALWGLENQWGCAPAPTIELALADAAKLVSTSAKARHPLTLSDHDRRSFAAYGEAIELVLAAAWLAGPRRGAVRGANARKEGRHVAFDESIAIVGASGALSDWR